MKLLTKIKKIDPEASRRLRECAVNYDLSGVLRELENNGDPNYRESIDESHLSALDILREDRETGKYGKGQLMALDDVIARCEQASSN